MKRKKEKKIPDVTYTVLASLTSRLTWDRFGHYIEELWFPTSTRPIYQALVSLYTQHPEIDSFSVQAIETTLSENDKEADLKLLQQAAKTEERIRTNTLVRWVKERFAQDEIARHQKNGSLDVSGLISRLSEIENLTRDEILPLDYLTYVPRRTNSMVNRRIPTPLYGLTKLYRGGIEPPNLVTVMGMPDAGKTLFSCAWGAMAARHRFGVLHVTTETYPAVVAERYDSALTMAGREYLYGDLPLLLRTKKRLRDRGAKVWIADMTQGGASLAGIRTLVERVSRKTRLDLIIVDRADLLAHVGGKDSGHTYACARVWRGLRQIAATHYVACIATTQINREGSKKSGDRVEMYDVAESWAKICDTEETIALGSTSEDRKIGRVIVRVLKTKKVDGYADFICQMDRNRCSVSEVAPIRRIKEEKDTKEKSDDNG